MTMLTRDALQELSAYSDKTCLTLLMPTSPSEPPHTDQMQLSLASRQCHFHILMLRQGHVALWHYDACTEIAQPVLLAHGRNGLDSMPQHEDLDAQRHVRSHTRSQASGSTWVAGERTH